MPLEHVIGVQIPASQPTSLAHACSVGWSARPWEASRLVSLGANGSKSLPPSQLHSLTLVPLAGRHVLGKHRASFHSARMVPNPCLPAKLEPEPHSERTPIVSSTSLWHRCISIAKSKF